MELKVTDEGTLQFLFDNWDIFVHMLAVGFTIASVVVVIVASIRLGWKFWPWILGLGALAFIFF